jgi:hypothetical protein
MHRMLWRRLDCPGQDGCRCFPTDTGWSIMGSAVYDLEGKAATLAYRLDCDGRWISQRAAVTGWLGALKVSMTLERQAGDRWQVNGATDECLTGLQDIDLGFTPASNTNALRRLALSPGTWAETTAVWLDADSWRVRPLVQSYRRMSHDTYAYTSPAHGYAATLRVDDFSAITDYPGFWAAMPDASALAHGQA